MPVTWCTIAAFFSDFTANNNVYIAAERNSLDNVVSVLLGGVQTTSKWELVLPGKVFAVADGCTCGRKSLGTPWLGISNSLKVDGLHRLAVALLGQAVTVLFCYWYQLKIFKPHTG